MSTHRKAVFSLLLLVAGFLCLAQAQVPMTGAGLGKPAAASGFTGAADIIASPKVFYGLQAPSAAYAAGLGKLANICTPLDAVCADVSSDANGNFNIGAVGSLTCNNSTVICTVKTLYDTSGSNSCAGSIPCDATQATIATRPTLVVALAANGCTNTALPCVSVAGAQCMLSPNFTQAQTFSISVVGKNTGAAQRPFVFGGPDQEFGARSSVNKWYMYANGATVVEVAATDNAWHAGQALYNNTSSFIAADGTSGSTGNAGTGGWSAVTIQLFGTGNCGANFISGSIAEIVIWSADQSSSFSALNTNQHSSGRWNF